MTIDRQQITKAEGLIPRPRPGRIDVPAIIETFAHHMMYTVARDQYTASNLDVFNATAMTVRDRLMERWFRTQDIFYRKDVKRVYYLSLEFLLGRALLNFVLNLGAEPQFAEAMRLLGYNLEQIEEKEADAGLGNGGLGRLAACFLDSASTLALPFYGYGIRYEYGIFRQRIQNGFQEEAPDNWLRYGNPWEVPRPDVLFRVKFYGRVQYYRDEQGRDRIDWVDTQDVYAMPYDVPVPGYRNNTVNSLRLWAARSSREFDLARFNAGQYVAAVEDKTQTENISKVLYPPDDQYAGRELRLKQQYFFVSATIQDVIRRFCKKPGRRWESLPDKVAIQLNDTHPAVAIAELMRVLVDRYCLDWEKAWSITQKVFGYTNHTVLPEALEVWPIDIFGRLLPRHLQIIEEIDRRLRQEVSTRYPGDYERVRKMAVIDEVGRGVRMANLAIVGSHSVNGVAELHTDILRQKIFPEFDELFPGRFNNKTNGITPRRWLLQSNPRLAALISEAIGDGWVKDLDQLRGLEPFAEDPGFRERWGRVKDANKHALAGWIHDTWDIVTDPETILDVQVKRIHEYKRQLLNVLHVIALFHRIVDGDQSVVPRTVLFAGKSAPSYAMAKLVIKLVHSVGALVRSHPAASTKLNVVFLPNYGVSCAERIFPACELSEQISTAGMEASGTGNMKASLNGALTIGTLDGANVEIRNEVGEENIFIFGRTAEEIDALRASGYNPREYIDRDPTLARVITALSQGLGIEDPGMFRPIVDALVGGDRYFHCADFGSYMEAQQRAARLYLDREAWNRLSILNVARMGKFSGDRTVRQYADEIWGARSVPIEMESGEATS
ncbi:MAG: glycogen/starch/alpha-glucan phosphorylase [Thermoanaerobaculia bacterium]